MVTLGTTILELEVGTSIGNCWLPVVTDGADPQDGGGIARSWIAGPKVYPGISVTQG